MNSGTDIIFTTAALRKLTSIPKKKVLMLEISFCFWMQEWYDKNEPSNGLIRLTFRNVSFFEYDADIADRIFSEIDSEIRSVELDDRNLVFFSVETPDFSNDDEDIYWRLKISATNVEVEELERYNL